jgi:predicted double-glycine peptidase
MNPFRRNPDRAPSPRMRKALLATAVCALLLFLAAGVAAAFPTAEPVSRSLVWLFGAEYLGRDGVVIQQGRADCGIAALQMILEPRGVPGASLDSARAAVLERGGEGASMLELKRLAEARGVRAEGWRMGMAALSRAPLPAVVHLGDHFAVVDRILADGRVELRDPSLGRMRVSGEDFRDILWTGNVLLFPRRARPRAAGAASASPSSTPRAEAAR